MGGLRFLIQNIGHPTNVYANLYCVYVYIICITYMYIANFIYELLCDFCNIVRTSEYQKECLQIRKHGLYVYYSVYCRDYQL